VPSSVRARSAKRSAAQRCGGVPAYYANSRYQFYGQLEQAEALALQAAAVGRWDTAEQHFAAAAEIHERLGAKLFLARTWMNWGSALLARGEASDAQRGRQLLQRAAELARHHGGGAVERDAEALLADPLGV